MIKKEKTRWEMGCFDAFESPFLMELYKIREKQAKKTKKLSLNKLVELIRSQAEKLRKIKKRGK